MKCIHGDWIYTGKSIRKNAFLVFHDKGLIGISDKPKGEVIGECAVLTPAFIDPHSHIGIHRHGEPAAEGESNDKIDALQPLPDALDSIQMDDVAFKQAAESGILYSCVVPGSGNLIGGLSAVVRHCAPHSTAALIGRAGVKAALGYNLMSCSGWKGTRPTTRRGSLAQLRAKFYSIRDKASKIKAKTKAKEDCDPLTAEEQVLKDVLDGKTRLRVHAHKIDDIASLLRVVDEFKLRVSVEHAMDVNRPEIFAELHRRRITVVYGPLESTGSKVELLHKDWRHARLLLESGVDFCVMTDHPVTPSWSLLQQTRSLLRCGLAKQAALETVTRKAAAFLGVDDRLGTLETGKRASFIAWNGDPFDLASRPLAVYAEGQRVFED